MIGSANPGFGPWLAGIGLNVCRHWLRQPTEESLSLPAVTGGWFMPEADWSATNAVVHGRSDIELVITADHPMARVQVSDAEPSLPVRRSPNEHAARGRGLHIVDALAEAWGVEQLLEGTGKCVWFEVRS